MDTSLRIDPTFTTGTGSDVSLERDLNFDERPIVVSGEAGWRFGRNWRVSAEFLRLSRRQTASLDREIVIGDTIYPVDASISSTFRSNLYKVQLGYSFISNSDAELGGTLGVHVTDFATSLKGQGSVSDGTGASLRTESRSILAPLPNIGAYGNVRLNKSVGLTGRINWLQLKVGDYSGGLTDLDAGIAWRFAPGLSATASWRILDYRLDIDRPAFEGSIRYKFSGPTVGVIATF